MSAGLSPASGSNIPFPFGSVNSKLLFTLSDNVISISPDSFPVITKGSSNCPVTKHDPCGIGEVAKSEFGTVVAPGGAPAGFKFLLFFLVFLFVYSYLKASIGSSLLALTAG